MDLEKISTRTNTRPTSALFSDNDNDDEAEQGNRRQETTNEANIPIYQHGSSQSPTETTAPALSSTLFEIMAVGERLSAGRSVRLCGAVLDERYLLIGKSDGLDFVQLVPSILYAASIPQPNQKLLRRQQTPRTLIPDVPFRQISILHKRSKMLVAIAGKNAHIRIYSLDSIRSLIKQRIREADELDPDEAKESSSWKLSATSLLSRRAAVEPTMSARIGTLTLNDSNGGTSTHPYANHPHQIDTNLRRGSIFDEPMSPPPPYTTSPSASTFSFHQDSSTIHLAPAASTARNDSSERQQSSPTQQDTLRPALAQQNNSLVATPDHDYVNDFVKLSNTKQSLCFDARESRTKTFLAVLCKQHIFLFAGFKKIAVTRVRAFWIPHTPERISLSMHGDDLVDIVLMYDQYLFAINVETTNVREIRIDFASSTLGLRSGENETDGGRRSEQQPRENSEERSRDSRREGRRERNPDSPDIDPSYLDDTYFYQGFQQLHFLPPLPSEVLTHHYTIPPSYDAAAASEAMRTQVDALGISPVGSPASHPRLAPVSVLSSQAISGPPMLFLATYGNRSIIVDTWGRPFVQKPIKWSMGTTVKPSPKGLDQQLRIGHIELVHSATETFAVAFSNKGVEVCGTAGASGEWVSQRLMSGEKIKSVKYLGTVSAGRAVGLWLWIRIGREEGVFRVGRKTV